jgi:hypothetical protein
MYHTIAFTDDVQIDLEISPKHPLEKTLLRKGIHWEVQLKPYVVGSDYEPVEVADLYFSDGSVARGVPFACFSFVE